MTNQLFNSTGSESNNSRAAAFEDQVAGWMRSLGWDPLCRNVDMYARTNEQSKGVDLLAAFDDPQLGHRQGLIAEAKIRHPLQGSKVRTEVAILAQKVAQLASQVPRLDVGEDVHVTQLGLIVYDAHPFDPEKLATALSVMQPKGMTRAEWPKTVLVVGPDTLIGLADAFSKAEPKRFFWPPYDRTPGKWAHAAPPWQVTAGVLAWRTHDRKRVLWLRDPLPHDDDLPSVCAIAHDWQINFDRIICSSLSRDRWATQRTRWESEAKKAKRRQVGNVPNQVEPRELSWDSLTPFVDRWGKEAT
ncbi:hypothetical protein [Patulibacter sp. SYSU D01012]|uniref:hypothetical protein n=1 Tax=Patulibacter sp. SYSU D01012 TaxID=2817381 RepID=UPI001B306EAC|nr:hypothetical protein [Patulibacter sp. SYSU D01012]